MNPCPCGFGSGPRCSCTPLARDRYRGRISGPLLDRIDLRVHVPAVAYRELRDGRTGLDTAAMAAMVATAREVQRRRFDGDPRLNATLRPAELRRHCRTDATGEKLLEEAMTSGRLTARGVGRVLRVARTLADLEGADALTPGHLLEALRWRVEL